VGRRLASSARRGYGQAHRRLRRLVGLAVTRGGATCARCGNPIRPGDSWDLGHDDVDRSRYTGPEHRACNRATAAHDAHRVTRRW